MIFTEKSSVHFSPPYYTVNPQILCKPWLTAEALLTKTLPYSTTFANVKCFITDRVDEQPLASSPLGSNTTRLDQTNTTVPTVLNQAHLCLQEVFIKATGPRLAHTLVKKVSGNAFRKGHPLPNGIYCYQLLPFLLPLCR